MIYRTAPFSVILNDPYPRFQGQAIAIFDAEYLRNGTIYWHRFNGILIGTYTRSNQQCRFEWLSKYSMAKASRGLSATAELLVLTINVMSLVPVIWLTDWLTEFVTGRPDRRPACRYFVYSMLQKWDCPQCTQGKNWRGGGGGAVGVGPPLENR